MLEDAAAIGPLSDLYEDVDLADAASIDLDALIREHAEAGLGPLWLGEIQKAARVARRYSPGIYARSATWDEAAMDDLVQDVVERLLGKSQIEYICDVANDFGHARALIYRQVKLTLADRRQRTAVDNLFERAVGRLGEAPFEQKEANPRSWGLVGTVTTVAPDGRRLTSALAALPRLPGLGVERASAVWTTETLTEALSLICLALGTVAEDSLKKILEEALTVFATTEVVTGEAGFGHRSEELDPGALAAANEALERLVGALTNEEATVLAGKWIGDSDGDLASRMGLSRPTVAKHKESAFAKVRDELGTSDDATVEHVFGRLQALVIVRVEGGAR